MSNFQRLLQNISQAKDEAELRSLVLPDLGEYFAAKRWGLLFFEQFWANSNKLPPQIKLALSTEYNPVLRYVVERHTPVHEELVVTPKIWHLICPRRDHWHVMAGPLIKYGQLVGLIGLTRDRGMPAFETENLLDLSALCLHISTWLTKVEFDNVNPMFNSDRLTPRQREIAVLVAQGKTNAQIAAELWITENSVKQALKRMFRKLEVSSRAEMVAKLAYIIANNPLEKSQT
ncbi:MAG: helix-turn-helix transcriptional regulator [Cyanobacteria bacterium P01_G01_bin.49]